MRFAGSIVVAGLLLVACAGSDDAVTTSTTSTPVSSTDPVTSSTFPSTSTSTFETTTTSPSLPEVSVVVAAEGVAGWWDGEEWHAVESTVPVREGAEYQVLAVGRATSISTGSALRPGCDVVEGSLAVDLDPRPWSFDPFAPSAIGVSAPWDVSPGPVQELAVTDVYVDVARALLAERGIDDPDPSYAQLIRTDIDSDGVFEIFAVLERRTGPDAGLIPAPAGDYSIAFARVVLDGDVETAVLGEWVVTEQPEGWIQDLQVYRFSAFADADGDGVDEVAVQQAYYEGSATLLWDWQGRDLGFVNVLSVGCGA